MLAHYANLLKEDDVTLFRSGACHVFTLALHERFGYPMSLIRDFRVPHQKNATHVYCHFSGTHSVDVVGIAPEKIALAELGWSGPNYSRVEASPNEIKTFYTTESGGGLYADLEFLTLTQERAQKRIKTYRDYYSETILSAVPRASRIRPASQKEIQAIFER